MPTVLRGKLRYIAKNSRLQQCPREPAVNPPLNVLLAVIAGIPNDVSGATNRLKNLGWRNGDCIEVQGQFTNNDDQTFYFQTVKTCPQSV